MQLLKKIKSIIQATTYRIADKSALILSKKCLISREENEFAGCREIWAQVLIRLFNKRINDSKKATIITFSIHKKQR